MSVCVCVFVFECVDKQEEVKSINTKLQHTDNNINASDNDVVKSNSLLILRFIFPGTIPLIVSKIGLEVK